LEPGHAQAIQKYLEIRSHEEILELNVKAGDVLIADTDAENHEDLFFF